MDLHWLRFTLACEWTAWFNIIHIQVPGMISNNTNVFLYHY